jgi:hypothetical protein
MIKIQVIDEKLLLETLTNDHSGQKEEQGKENLTSIKSQNLLKEDVSLIDLIPETKSLIFSFKNIGKIENLNGFDKIIKLCLDNNSIEEICNLDHFIHLKWLDLSFNKITKITGLDKLKSLEDLSLCNNKITIVEGLDKLPKLQCLSLGSNLISNFSDTLSLRYVKSLKMITLMGNPLSHDEYYKKKALAYFPQFGTSIILSLTPPKRWTRLSLCQES